MASTYLTRTFGSPTNNYKWTFSAWIKKCGVTADQYIFQTYPSGEGYMRIYFQAADTLKFDGEDTSAGNAFSYVTNRKFRDVNAWYHLVVKWDVTQGTAGDRVKIYINGVEETSFSTSTNPAQNIVYPINRNKLHNLGRHNSATDTYFDGVISHVHFVDGTAYDASTFGSTDSSTGEWKINTSPTMTMGTNGFTILKDGMTITDQSANSNDWTLANGTLTKTEDCPSNVFCTANPLSSGNSEAFNGNTNIFFDDTGQWRAMYSTLGASSGKFYMEAKVDAVGGEASIGVIPADRAAQNQDTGDYLGKETDSIGYLNNGRIFKSNSQLETGLASMSSGTIVGISLNLDANTVQFYNNDSAVGSAVSLNADTTYLFGFSGYSDTRFYANFGNGYFHTTAVSSAGTNASGNGIFEYDVKPSDATALSTKGLNL